MLRNILFIQRQFLGASRSVILPSALKLTAPRRLASGPADQSTKDQSNKAAKHLDAKEANTGKNPFVATPDPAPAGSGNKPTKGDPGYTSSGGWFTSWPVIAGVLAVTGYFGYRYFADSDGDHKSVHDKTKEVQEKGKDFVDKAKGAAGHAADKVKEAAGKVSDHAKETADKAKGAVHDAHDKAKGAVDSAGDKAKEAADKAGDKAKGAADKAGDKAKETADKAKGAAHDVADKAKGAADKAGDKAKDAQEKHKPDSTKAPKGDSPTPHGEFGADRSKSPTGDDKGKQAAHKAGPPAFKDPQNTDVDKSKK